MSNETIRVLLADDHAMVWERLLLRTADITARRLATESPAL
jgi:hypothetical protein